MKVEIVGYAKVNYYSKKKEKQIQGIQFFVTFKDRNTTGLRVDSIYINDPDVVPPLTLPAKGEVEYNRYGYVEDLIFT